VITPAANVLVMFGLGLPGYQFRHERERRFCAVAAITLNDRRVRAERRLRTRSPQPSLSLSVMLKIEVVSVRPPGSGHATCRKRLAVAL
jgi:hypothetical protein